MESKMRIKIMPFLQKKGNRVAKAAVEFDNFCDCGPAQFVGFTICDDKERGLYLLFPAANNIGNGGEKRTFFMLRPMGEDFLQKLQDKILDTYEAMTSFNSPQMRSAVNQQHQHNEAPASK